METPIKSTENDWETIDNRPNFIKENEVGIWVIIYNNIPIPYTIMKKEAVPSLKWFLWYPEWKYLFISEEVPEKFREPQLMHEIVEFTELKWKKWRCLQSLKYELSFIAEDMWQEYIEYRRDFFKRLVEFHKNTKTDKFDADEFRWEIQQSYEYLKSIE